MATNSPIPVSITTNITLFFVNESLNEPLENNGGAILIMSSTPTDVATPSTKIISDEVLYWTEIIGYIALNGTISIFGIIANIINIVVFVRQGVLSDSNTFSLLALSISDMCSLFTLLWVAICFMLIYIPPPDLPFNSMDMLYVTGGRPHLMFVQITSWFTVYIAFERCMCVVFPFKVKRLFTPTRTSIVLPCIAVLIIFGGYLPYYLDEYLIWEEKPNSTKSILVIYRTYGNQTVLNDSAIILNAFVSQPTAILLVLILTQITVFRVNVSKKWRDSTSLSNSKDDQKEQKTLHKTNQDGKDSHSQTNRSAGYEEKKNAGVGGREKRLVKMITAISTIFLVCMTPDTIFMIIEMIEEDIRPGYRFHNLFFFNYAISFLLEAVNASINIFVYYRMSTKYRNEFRKLIGVDK